MLKYGVLTNEWDGMTPKNLICMLCVKYGRGSGVRTLSRASATSSEVSQEGEVEINKRKDILSQRGRDRKRPHVNFPQMCTPHT